MKIHNNNLEQNNDLQLSQTNQNELVTAEEQNSFLNSTLGQVIDSGLDIGLRMLLPDSIEDSALEIKDSFMQNGFKVKR